MTTNIVSDIELNPWLGKTEKLKYILLANQWNMSMDRGLDNIIVSILSVSYLCFLNV